MHLGKPHKTVKDALLILLGLFGAVSGTYGLWDEIRFQVEVCGACGFYSLPFGLSVVWWLAADLLVAVTFAGSAVFLLAFIDLTNG